MNARAARWGALALLLAVAGFYAWTASVTTPDDNDLQYYDQLADAFVHGRLDLRPGPPAGLLALPNPYDPSANQQFRDMGFHDLALYHGRFYTVWGPAPALVLFAPLRLVGIDLSHAVAAFVLGLATWLFACAALWVCVRRWLPDTRRWMLAVGAVLLAAGDVVPFLMRRPKVYEVAVLGGVCFSMGAVWLLLAGGMGRRASPKLLALGSLCLGLAIGSRPDLAVGLLAAGLLAIRLWRTERGPARNRAVVALLGPVAVCLLLLALYNQARFGSFTDTGNTHQLSSFDPHTFDWGSLAYIAPGLYWLLLSPPEIWIPPFTGNWSILVPRSYPGALPAGFSNPGAPIGGLLPTVPFVGLLATLPWAARVRRPHRSLAAVIAVLLGCTVLVLLVLTYLIYPVERYAGDYTAVVLLAAILAWMLAADLLRGRRWLRGALQSFALVAATWTVYVGVVMSAPKTIGH